MIHLRLHTEFNFRRAFGRVEDVLRVAGGSAAAITDRGTWGHVTWAKACKKAGIKPIFGVEIDVVADARKKGEKQPSATVVLLARNDAGLRELYSLVTTANTRECFYYVPRLDYSDINGASPNVYVLAGPGTIMDRLSRARPTTYLMLTPTNASWNRRSVAQSHFPCVVACDNVYPLPEDLEAYEYQARLERELDMIEQKKFEDYFYLVGDLVRWAKTKMLVGPARGSRPDPSSATCSASRTWTRSCMT
jgi:DNA polymerase III alpha subunit